MQLRATRLYLCRGRSAGIRRCHRGDRRLPAERIGKIGGAIASVGIDVDTACEADRVFRDEPSELRIVVSRPRVRETWVAKVVTSYAP